jgi:hypothetical protein
MENEPEAFVKAEMIQPELASVAAPTIRKRVSISVYIGIASLVVSVGGVSAGIFMWHWGTFVLGIVGGISLGIIAGLWGITDVIIGMVKKSSEPIPPQSPTPPELSQITHTESSAGYNVTLVPAQTPEPSTQRTGGLYALVLGGGSVAAIIITLVIIVGLVIFAFHYGAVFLNWFIDVILPVVLDILGFLLDFFDS